MKITIGCDHAGVEYKSKIVEFLEKEGFSNIYNLKGGITAWSKEIDTSIAVA